MVKEKKSKKGDEKWMYKRRECSKCITFLLFGCSIFCIRGA